MKTSPFNPIPQLKARYAALAPSDRRALGVLAGFLVAVVFTLAVLLPSMRYRARGADQYQVQLELLEWMKANAALVHAEPAAAAPSDSLLAIVDSAAKQSGISLQRYEPLEQGDIRLYFEGAVFDDLMQWLESLTKSHGIEVAYISVDRGTGAGLVDVRLDLTN